MEPMCCIIHYILPMLFNIMSYHIYCRDPFWIVKYGGTALSLAAANGHLDVVKILVEHKNIEINARDNVSMHFPTFPLPSY